MTARRAPAAEKALPWLLLIHQIPPKPDYFRVRVRRRLHRLGAIPIKNSVYALPATPGSREDFEWLAREIVQDGGEAAVCEATFVCGLTDGEVQAMFVRPRQEDYQAIATAARALATGEAEGVAAQLPRLRRRMAAAVEGDYFGAPGREEAEGALLDAERMLQRGTGTPDGGGRRGQAAPPPRPGRTWVTRRGVHVDRIGSAWLIRRFIDRKARFVFIDPGRERPPAGGLRFDMYDAEFTHVGDRCTFEVLVEHFGLAAPGLRRVAEIVHDIDCKDGKFGRSEVAGMSALIDGIVHDTAGDALRLERGAALFDALLAAPARRRS